MKNIKYIYLLLIVFYLYIIIFYFFLISVKKLIYIVTI